MDQLLHNIQQAIAYLHREDLTPEEEEVRNLRVQQLGPSITQLIDTIMEEAFILRYTEAMHIERN